MFIKFAVEINQVNSPDSMAIKFTKSFIACLQKDITLSLAVNVENSELPINRITKIEVFDIN